MNILKTVTIVICVFFFAQIAKAQYGGFNNYSSAAALQVRQHIQRAELRNSINRRMINNRTNRRSGKVKENKVIVPKVAIGPSSFVMKNPLLPEQFMQSFKGTPAEKKAGVETLNSFLDKYKTIAVKDGFPSNDLAYAFNYYLIHNYVVYHDLYNLFYTDPNRRRVFPNGVNETEAELNERLSFNSNTIPTERKIYDQYRTFMNSSPDIKKMTNEQKQLFAELLATISVMTFNVYNDANLKNNSNKYYGVREIAKNNLENFFGVTVDKIKITEDGVSISD